MAEREDLSGRVFDRLTVAEYVGFWGGRARWRCMCSCGTETVVAAPALIKGATTSCGCKVREPGHGPVVHGMSRKPVHAIWRSMLARCLNPNAEAYARYGRRGITVCDRWRDFSNFYADMGDPPPGKTLERMDNDGPYEPGNCRWATRTEQGRNKRSNRLITFNGETLPVSAWAERTAISAKTIRTRIARNWPESRLLEPTCKD